MPEKNFTHETVKHKRAFDKRSFRTKKMGAHRVTFGCKKGEWMPRKKICKVPVEIQKILHPVGENPKKCKANPILETALGVGLGVTVGALGQQTLRKAGILKNPYLLSKWAKKIGKTTDQLTAADMKAIYYAIEKKKKTPFIQQTGEEVLKKMGLRKNDKYYDDYWKAENYWSKLSVDKREDILTLLSIQKKTVYAHIPIQSLKYKEFEEIPQAIRGALKLLLLRLMRKNPGAAWHVEEMKHYKIMADAFKRQGRERLQDMSLGAVQAHKRSLLASKRLSINPSVRYYIGVRGAGSSGVPFMSAAIPTKKSHGEFKKVIGPFANIQGLLNYASKNSIKIPGRENPKTKSSQWDVFDKHQYKIAEDTLKMTPAMARIMGGPSVEEAKEIIKRLKTKYKRNPRFAITDDDIQNGKLFLQRFLKGERLDILITEFKYSTLITNGFLSYLKLKLRLHDYKLIIGRIGRKYKKNPI
ncbi:MAG: hypothetical protein ABIG95_02500 [Candidatus Woesearchaeota archaeon]